MTDTLSTAEVAAILDVHPNTVRNWTKSGDLRASLRTVGNQARYRRIDVIRLVARLRKRAA